MDKFVTSIKRKYRERLLQREQQWPPVSVEKLVNLQLVEAEKKEGFRAGLPQHGAPDDKVKRTPILHGDLFKVEEGKKPVRKLIVEGNAGIGKTTLCTMLTEEWADGEILTQFDCVLLLPLRERSVSTATTLPQLFKLLHSSERIRTSVIEELEEREGEGVLIIADGWDELDDENRSDDSFLHNLLFGNTLPFASVLLTSRPFASVPLHNIPTVDRLVEVIGFNEENVKQYIEADFEKCPEKASSLIEQLDNNPLIMSVCSVPLNCAIVCNLWHTLDSVVPKTLTELYSQIVLNVILRNLRKQISYQELVSISIDSIPEDLQDMFWLMCKFAYECFLQDKIVFLKDEIFSLFPHILDCSENVLCFGLLQCARSLLPVGQGLSFHFVHLTIQEFLAALHLVTLPNEDKLKICEAHAASNQFAMVWRFVFGLGCQKEGSYSRKVVCLDGEVVDLFLNTDRDDLFSHVRLMFCHCSLESMNNTVGLKIARQINGKFKVGYFSSITTTPHDCVAVFHVLQHTTHCSNIEINLNYCGLTDKLLKKLTDILFCAGGDLQVTKLSLINNKITENGITDLFSRASTSFSFLNGLYLSNNNIMDISLPSSSCNSLRKLFLSDNPLGVSGIQSLETAVQAGVLVNLRRLYLSNTLTDDTDINGALLATLSPSIASHCPHLWKLDLSSNNLGVPGASALSGLFTSDKSILGLVESIGNSSAEIAAFGVSYNSHSLYFSNNLVAVRHEFELALHNANINAEAVASLNIFSTLSCDCTLNLSNNPLGYDGLLAIFKMLSSETCPITELSLGNTDLTITDNTDNQCQSLNTSNVFGPVLDSSRLTKLHLHDNNFSGDRALILAECVRVCKSLKRLYCWNCFLTSSEVINILDHLESTTHISLCWWDLSDNSIDDEGVNALIERLPRLFPNLKDIGCKKNFVSGEVQKRLEEILKVINTEFIFPATDNILSFSGWSVLNLQVNREDEQKTRRSAVLTEWERTWSPPQSEEVC